MNLEPSISLRIAGIILILSVLLPMIWLIIVTKGDFSGFQASVRGIDGVGQSAIVLNKANRIASFTVVLTLAGYGMLTLLLRESGDSSISLLAFNLLLFSQVFIILQGTFHGTITSWASTELAESGSVPEIFYQLWHWMYSGVQEIYVMLGLLALACFGWAMLTTGLMQPWLGWGLIGFSGVWIVLFLIAGDNLPLVLYIPPLVIGITAIIKGS